MKRLSLLFSLILIAWIAVVSYWYVCKIRNQCGEAVQATAPEMIDTLAAEDTKAVSPETVEADSVAITMAYLDAAGTKVYYFEFASSELNAANDDDMYFTSLGYLLTHKPGSSVRVVGHACSRGSAAANERFSRLRAERVKQHLVENGIEGEKITLEWKGDREPAASNDTEEGRKLNRRVEITINQ